MTDAPERLWAVRSDDGLPQYADTPFGIWWHTARDGYTEYRRTDLPPTVAEAMRCPEVRALVEVALASRRWVENMAHGWPRAESDLEQIDAALAAFQQETDR